jgi:hypothetical protein
LQRLISFRLMTSFDSILKQVRDLPLEERVRLAQHLLKDAEAEEQANIGERGLTALTNSTQHEDWSQFYPSGLRNRKAG